MNETRESRSRGGMSAYAYFILNCRDELKEKYSEDPMIFDEFSKKCAERWKSYVGDLKTRNKISLRPIDIAKMHGYKDCVNYLATLEACLSLAEENIALETELLHYGAELSELEKCFKELLQLTKSDRLQIQGSYFGSVVDTIERKWKRCKAKSLGSHGVPDQNAYNLFQSHFSRIVTDDVLSELSFSSSSNHQQQSFIQKFHQNRFSDPHSPSHQHHISPDNHRNLVGRTTARKKCNDPFLELSNGHYSLFSSDTDYAVPYKTSKPLAGKKSDNPVILGRRGMKLKRDQPEGSSVPSYPKSSPSLYESYKPNHHLSSPSSSSQPSADLRGFTGGFEEIDLDLDLDDEDYDELSGYSSLKPSNHQNLPFGIKGSPSINRSNRDKVDGQHPKQLKESPRESITNTTENLSESESKTSDGRESSINESVSTKENYSGLNEPDSGSVSRKRGFLHKFSLRKWATSTASKPKKSYSKETLLRPNGGCEGTVREEMSGKCSSPEINEKEKSSCKSFNGKLIDGDEKETENWWPSSHEKKINDSYEKDDNNICNNQVKETQSTDHLPDNCNSIKIVKNSSSSSLDSNKSGTCQNINFVNISSKSTIDKRFNNYVNNENTDKQVKQAPQKGDDRSESLINKSKVNYCQFTNDKIRSASMEAIDINPEANHHHYQVNTDNYSLISTKPSTSVIRESKLISGLSPNGTKYDSNSDAIDSINLTSPDPVDETINETLTTAQNFPILSNSVYGVKHVKKAKIKELPPLNYEELTPPPSNPPPPSPSMGNVATAAKFSENRKKMFEKGPGNKNTRGLRRRRNGNRAWYDVSDDEDGLVTQKFTHDKVTETQEC